MPAGSIVVDLLLKTGSFETDTDRAAKKLKQFKKEADDLGQKLGIAFTAAGVGLAALVKSSIDTEDHLNDLAQKTGIAADTLGGIGFAASQAGLDLDSAALGIGKLNKSIAEAASGNKTAQEAFDALKISVKDLSGNTKTADQILGEVADKFAGYADGPEKAALALRLFGKAGADMIPLLNGGSQAISDQIAYFKKYSGVTVETAHAADEFNDTLSKIKLLSSAFGRTLTSDLLGPLQSLADLWLKNKEQGDQFKETASTVADLVKALAFAALAGAEGFVALGKAIGGAVAAQVAFATGHPLDAIQISKEALSDLGAAKDRVTALFDAIYNGKKSVNDAGGGRGFVNPALAAPTQAAPRLPGGNPTTAPSDFDRLIKQATEQAASAQAALDELDDSGRHLTEAQKAGAKVAADYAAGLVKLTPTQFGLVNASLKAADALEREVEKRQEAIKWIQEATDANASYVEQQQRYRDQLEQGLKRAEIERASFGLTAHEVDLLASARARDAAAALEQKANQADAAYLDDLAKLYRQQAQAIRDTADATDELSAKTEKARTDFGTGADEAFKKFRYDASSSGKFAESVIGGGLDKLTDAFAEFAKTGKLHLGDLFSFMADEFIKNWVRMQIAGSQGSIGGSSGGLLGLFGAIGGLFGGNGYTFDAGGVGTNNTGGSLPTSGGRADGGPVSAGHTYVVGERGPELLHMGSNGAITPNGRGMQVNIHNNVAGAGVRTETDENGDLQVWFDKAVAAGARRGHAMAIADIVNGGRGGMAVQQTYGLQRNNAKRG